MIALLLKKRQVRNNVDSENLVYLRALNHKDKDKVCRWMVSSYVIHHTFVVPGPYAIPHDFATHAYAERYFYQLMSDKNRRTFAIIKGREHIGNIGLKEIDFDQLKAECFIEIGHKENRNKGFGFMAMRQLLSWAFLNLGLEKIELDVLEFNTPAIKIYDRLGFVAEPSFMWHYDEFGMYWHVIKMSLTKSILLGKKLRINPILDHYL